MSFPHIRKSAHDSYADTPFMDEIALIKIPRKFSFTNIRMYDSTDSLENHVVFYKQTDAYYRLPEWTKENHDVQRHMFDSDRIRFEMVHQLTKRTNTLLCNPNRLVHGIVCE